MYYSGQANRSSFYYGMIEQGNRRAVPYAVNGNTMIPIRALIEGLGGTVDWDAKLNGARATLGDNKITMPIGSEYAYVNDEPVKMTTPAVIANGKTMIPVRFVAENLGYDVEWVADGQFVVIKELAASKKIASYGFINGGPDNYYTNFENGEFSCYQLGKVGKYTFWSQGEDSHGDWGYYTCFITHSDIEDFDKYLSEHYSVSDRFDVPSGFKVYDCYMESDLDPDDDTYTVIVRYKNAPIMFEIIDYGYSSDRETFDKFVSDLLSSIYVIYAG